MNDKLYVIYLNDGLFDGGKIFKGIEQVEIVFEKLLGNKELVDAGGDIIEIRDLEDCKQQLVIKGLCEYGDDYVEMGFTEVRL